MLTNMGSQSVETRAAMVRMMQAMRPSTNGKISTGKSMLARRSEKVRDVVFTNCHLFSCYTELPVAGYETHLRTHYREACFDTYLPIRAWFFLGEITNSINALNNSAYHRILVRDRKGKDNIPIDFDNKATVDKSLDYALLKRGHTVCIRFASRQKTSLGIRIDESFKKVQVFPTSLEILLTTMSNEINEHIPLRPWVKPSDAQVMAHCLDKTRHPLHFEAPPPAQCWNCRKKETSDSELKLMKCARCEIALYCDKTCQTDHWITSHKRCCKSHSIYALMVDEVKQSLDNMAKYLFEFVSTDDEEENDLGHKLKVEVMTAAKATIPD